MSDLYEFTPVPAFNKANTNNDDYMSREEFTKAVEEIYIDNIFNTKTKKFTTRESSPDDAMALDIQWAFVEAASAKYRDENDKYPDFISRAEYQRFFEANKKLADEIYAGGFSKTYDPDQKFYYITPVLAK